MPPASGEFFQVIDGLHQAVEREFKGNDYYLMAHQVIELREILHGQDARPQSSDAYAGFSSTLDALRKQAEAELLDNRFYLVSHKLDVLGFLGRRSHVQNGNGVTMTANNTGLNGVSHGADGHGFEAPGRSADEEQPATFANGELEGEAPARVPDYGSGRARDPWKRWSPPPFLSKPLRVFPLPPVYRRVWDHRPLKAALIGPPALVAPARPKKPPPRERFVLPRQRMIARPLQPAKR
jgi:hypothetical protein